jgi:lysophospholipase L1-like esterase
VANGCFRSTANYPALVAKQLGATLDDRSCGGAETKDFLTSQFPDVPPQLEALNRRTDVVTFGVGGNDQRVFGRLVGRCPALRESDPDGSPCEEEMGAGGEDALVSAIGETGVKVTRLLRDVHRRAPKAKVLVVGYPQIVTADDACSELPLARGDYAYAEKVNFALTEMLRRAARDTGSTYVDVWSASRGHDICSDDPWVNGSVTDRQKALAYHPFAAGMRADAREILAALDADATTPAG